MRRRDQFRAKPAAVVIGGLLLATLLAACSGSSTDPRQGGLAGGINGMTTGAYDQRLEQRKSEIADLDAAGKSLEQRVGNSQGTLKGLDRQLASQRASLQRLKAELAVVDQAITAARNARPDSNDLDRVNAENARKEQALRPLLAEKARLDGMVADLERRHAIQVAEYEQSKGKRSAPPGNAPAPESRDVQLADIEKRSKETDSQTTQALSRLEQLKAALVRAGF